MFILFCDNLGKGPTHWRGHKQTATDLKAEED